MWRQGSKKNKNLEIKKKNFTLGEKMKDGKF